jgi:hypothetical protein
MAGGARKPTLNSANQRGVTCSASRGAHDNEKSLGRLRKFGKRRITCAWLTRPQRGRRCSYGSGRQRASSEYPQCAVPKTRRLQRYAFYAYGMMETDDSAGELRAVLDEFAGKDKAHGVRSLLRWFSTVRKPR